MCVWGGGSHKTPAGGNSCTFDTFLGQVVSSLGVPFKSKLHSPGPDSQLEQTLTSLSESVSVSVANSAW